MTLIKAVSPCRVVLREVGIGVSKTKRRFEDGAALRFLPSKRRNGADYLPKLEEVAPGHFVAEHDPLEVLLAQD